MDGPCRIAGHLHPTATVVRRGRACSPNLALHPRSAEWLDTSVAAPTLGWAARSNGAVARNISSPVHLGWVARHAGLAPKPGWAAPRQGIEQEARPGCSLGGLGCFQHIAALRARLGCSVSWPCAKGRPGRTRPRHCAAARPGCSTQWPQGQLTDPQLPRSRLHLPKRRPRLNTTHGPSPNTARVNTPAAA